MKDEEQNEGSNPPMQVEFLALRGGGQEQLKPGNRKGPGPPTEGNRGIAEASILWGALFLSLQIYSLIMCPPFPGTRFLRTGGVGPGMGTIQALALSPRNLSSLLPARRGPNSRRGRASQSEVSRPRPSAALAAPEIRIKCGLGRRNGWEKQRQQPG